MGGLNRSDLLQYAVNKPSANILHNMNFSKILQHIMMVFVTFEINLTEGYILFSFFMH